MSHLVIGAGGGGCRLVPELVRLCRGERITIVDGDTVEERNLDRQLFQEHDIGENKARALQAATPHNEMVWFADEFFHAHMFTDDEERLTLDDILWCCADNHTCRREVLRACDHYGCRAVILGNEYQEFEAYWYEPQWCGTPNDPRIFYPIIETDHTGDPLSPDGCTGAAQVASPQLCIANAGAVTLAMWLYWFHEKIRPDLPRTDEVKAAWPVHHLGNQFRFSTIKYGDRKEVPHAANP